MTRPDHCPHCDVSLLGDPIPEHINQPYFSKYTGKMEKPYGDATHWRREIGIEVMGAYDGILYYRCPDCGGLWNRWPKSHYLYKTAEREMKKDRRGQA